MRDGVSKQEQVNGLYPILSYVGSCRLMTIVSLHLVIIIKKKVDYNDEGVVYLSLANLFSTAVRDTKL